MLYKKMNNFFTFYKKNFKLIFSSLFLIVLIMSCILIPYCSFYEYNPNRAIYSIKQEISWKHWFGTDQIGYDLFSRVLAGAKISLFLSFFSILISSILGTFLGIISGYFRGFLDQLVNFVCDFLVIIPEFILAFILMLFLVKNIITLIIVLIISKLPSFIRIIRANILQLKQKDFIKASKALGSNDYEIIRRHIIPNIWPILITQITINIANNILSIAGLGFIGLALDPTIPEWGNILKSVQSVFRYYPHLFFCPFIIILLTILSFNLIGKGLIEYFDTKRI